MSIHNVTRTTHTYTQKHIHVIVTRTSNKTNPETQARTWEIVYMMASSTRHGEVPGVHAVNLRVFNMVIFAGNVTVGASMAMPAPADRGMP